MSKQKRGKKVLESIEASLKLLVYDAKKNNKTFKYNMSELQRVSGISRVTQSKYANEIDLILEKIGAEEKIKYGKAGIQHLLEQLEKQDSKIKQLEKELSTLRGHHVKIYDVLFEQSIDISVFIEKEVEAHQLQGSSIIKFPKT